MHQAPVNSLSPGRNRARGEKLFRCSRFSALSLSLSLGRERIKAQAEEISDDDKQVIFLVILRRAEKADASLPRRPEQSPGGEMEEEEDGGRKRLFLQPCPRCNFLPPGYEASISDLKKSAAESSFPSRLAFSSFLLPFRGGKKL